MASTFFIGVLWTNQVLLNIVIPLWLVQETDAPRVLLAFLFGTNTVMCILLPMAAARGVKDVTTALRAIRVSMTFFVASCLITALHARHRRLGDHRARVARPRHRHRGGALPLGGQLVVRSRADGPRPSRRIPGRRRAQRHPRPGVGARPLHVPGDDLGRVVGWLLIAAIVVVATVGLHPAARRAQRFLREHGTAPDDPDAADSVDEQATPVPPPSLLQEPPLAPATGGTGPTTAPD